MTTTRRKQHAIAGRLIECECGVTVPAERYEAHRLEATKGRLAAELLDVADGLGRVDRLMRIRARATARHYAAFPETRAPR